MGMGSVPTSGGGGEEDDEAAIFAEINITPLTDVILVLLIITMLFASAAEDRAERVERRVAKKERSGLKVNLPSGAAKEIDPGAASLVVGITADGKVAINGQQVKESDVSGVFQSAFGKDRETQVVIKADGKTDHERVVKVMEAAKNVGLTRIAIATQGGQ